MVAKGFTQKFGTDYNKVFVPIARSESVWGLLVKASLEKMKVTHYDFETAFLNSDLPEELYMKQIEGFECADKQLVLRLHKSIYGLFQTAHDWNLCVT